MNVTVKLLLLHLLSYQVFYKVYLHHRLKTHNLVKISFSFDLYRSSNNLLYTILYFLE